jgi:hypothetical protein
MEGDIEETTRRLPLRQFNDPNDSEYDYESEDAASKGSEEDRSSHERY